MPRHLQAAAHEQAKAKVPKLFLKEVSHHPLIPIRGDMNLTSTCFLGWQAYVQASMYEGAPPTHTLTLSTLRMSSKCECIY